MIDLASVIPHWQWRTFAPDLSAAEQRFQAGLGPPEVSDEVHVLSPRDDVSVRIRRDELDVKVLRLSEGGLEQWAPILHARFPISLFLVNAIFAAWHRAAPAPLQPAYTTNEFLEDLIARQRDLDVIRLQRARRIGQLDACQTESSLLTIGGDAAMQTIALKHEDPLVVLGALRALDLTGRENVNYLNALRRWLQQRRNPPCPPNRSDSEPKLASAS